MIIDISLTLSSISVKQKLVFSTIVCLLFTAPLKVMAVHSDDDEDDRKPAARQLPQPPAPAPAPLLPNFVPNIPRAAALPDSSDPFDVFNYNSHSSDPFDDFNYNSQGFLLVDWISPITSSIHNSMMTLTPPLTRLIESYVTQLQLVDLDYLLSASHYEHYIEQRNRIDPSIDARQEDYRNSEDSEWISGSRAQTTAGMFGINLPDYIIYSDIYNSYIASYTNMNSFRRQINSLLNYQENGGVFDRLTLALKSATTKTQVNNIFGRFYANKDDKEMIQALAKFDKSRRKFSFWRFKTTGHERITSAIRQGLFPYMPSDLEWLLQMDHDRRQQNRRGTKRKRGN